MNITISDGQWRVFQRLLERPARDLPRLRALLAKPSPFAADSQAETVTRLNGLSTPYWTVDAGPLPTVATVLCVNDTAHGWGTCYAPGLDGACTGCAAAWARWVLVAGAHISIDVLQTPEGTPQ
jgi:hypothetical protein